MTSPHLVPNENPRRAGRQSWPTRIPDNDYGESWVLDAVCSCGARWHTMSGRRSWTKRRSPIRADYDAHRRRGHCVLVRSVKFELYNSKLVATHIVTAILSAFDQIA